MKEFNEEDIKKVSGGINDQNLKSAVEYLLMEKSKNKKDKIKEKNSMIGGLDLDHASAIPSIVEERDELQKDVDMIDGWLNS